MYFFASFQDSDTYCVFSSVYFITPSSFTCEISPTYPPVLPRSQWLVADPPTRTYVLTEISCAFSALSFRVNPTPWFILYHLSSRIKHDAVSRDNASQTCPQGSTLKGLSLSSPVFESAYHIYLAPASSHKKFGLHPSSKVSRGELCNWRWPLNSEVSKGGWCSAIATRDAALSSARVHDYTFVAAKAGVQCRISIPFVYFPPERSKRLIAPINPSTKIVTKSHRCHLKQCHWNDSLAIYRCHLEDTGRTALHHGCPGTNTDQNAWTFSDEQCQYPLAIRVMLEVPATREGGRLIDGAHRSIVYPTYFTQGTTLAHGAHK
ncbi:hypothetical protein AG1IA_03089 [Rhizoctonia solani AG-1 IA]|uniref:Uncharacterized protein n=1 Tax=Thanatephorus cucumeris (strain AG1-IA) TaxID=983506 RepID=L8X1A4_THACA|nr:hypothetical protein AG1IA_03089 [Rhizoctonia solani AG-1 IA]